MLERLLSLLGRAEKPNPFAATPVGNLNSGVTPEEFRSATMPEGRGRLPMAVASDILSQFASISTIWRSGVEHKSDEHGRPVIFVKYARESELPEPIVTQIREMAFPYRVNLYQQNNGEHRR